MSTSDTFLEFISEAVRIVEEAEKKGITLRILGAVAIRLHCPKFRSLFDAMKRAPTDIDLMAYGKDRPLLRSFFTEIGFVPDDRVITLHGYRRHIYRQKEKGIMVDVFFDALEFCHTIKFLGRLELDTPTATLADLLLSKMQIVRLNEKDVKDVIIMFMEHDVGETDEETINAAYIARILSDDWGFYHTFTTNMNKVMEFLKEFMPLKEGERAEVLAKMNKVMNMIEDYPKTLKWKLRAKIGTSRKWYNDVDEYIR